MEGINDIFIQNTSGIPYVARCYGGNYCQTQPDHELVTGFFAAINSFKGELGQKELHNVVYDQINLIFESQDEVLVVCNIDSNVEEATFREVASTLLDTFMDKYSDNGEIEASPHDDFSDYITWMDETVGQGMGDLRGLLYQPRKGILSRIKDWLI